MHGGFVSSLSLALLFLPAALRLGLIELWLVVGLLLLQKTIVSECHNFSIFGCLPTFFGNTTFQNLSEISLISKNFKNCFENFSFADQNETESPEAAGSLVKLLVLLWVMRFCGNQGRVWKFYFIEVSKASWGLLWFL